jgi:hypothetical protein
MTGNQRTQWLTFGQSKACSCILRVLIFCAGTLVGLGLAATDAPKVELNPTEFKALTLARIPPYVQWPEKALDDSETNLVIGIVGKDPFDGLLGKLVKDQKIYDRDVIVKVFEDPGQVTKCHILFVPAESQAQWHASIKNMDAFGVLTVGESDNFIKLGGVFNLSVKERKLEINLSNAKKAGLAINSKLLKIAKVSK